MKQTTERKEGERYWGKDEIIKKESITIQKIAEVLKEDWKEQNYCDSVWLKKKPKILYV